MWCDLPALHLGHCHSRMYECMYHCYVHVVEARSVLCRPAIAVRRTLSATCCRASASKTIRCVRGGLHVGGIACLNPWLGAAACCQWVSTGLPAAVCTRAQPLLPEVHGAAASAHSGASCAICTHLHPRGAARRRSWVLGGRAHTHAHDDAPQAQSTNCKSTPIACLSCRGAWRGAPAHAVWATTNAKRSTIDHARSPTAPPPSDLPTSTPK